mmetsp:Transcript_9480/g.11038  ORF Transcript_9480/g.11038 Transcript_9480/m.11038 type:complete len:157 (+) Transcript_9480:104-574(+)
MVLRLGYVQAAVKNVEEKLLKDGETLPRKVRPPFSSDYRPELDVTATLNPRDAAYYQSLVGVLRWIVELGRVDICVDVSMMSSQMAMPRYGHLQRLYHIFAYLKIHHNAEMVFDPSEPEIDMNQFEEEDWSSTVYKATSQEEIPKDMSQSRGLGFR